jgi:hypothetical protein
MKEVEENKKTQEDKWWRRKIKRREEDGKDRKEIKEEKKIKLKSFFMSSPCLLFMKQILRKIDFLLVTRTRLNI